MSSKIHISTATCLDFHQEQQSNSQTQTEIRIPSSFSLVLSPDVAQPLKTAQSDPHGSAPQRKAKSPISKAPHLCLVVAFISNQHNTPPCPSLLLFCTWLPAHVFPLPRHIASHCKYPMLAVLRIRREVTLCQILIQGFYAPVSARPERRFRTATCKSPYLADAIVLPSALPHGY